MSRPAAVSADQIRATVLAMLAEAGDTTPSAGAAEPVTRERFRRAVSVRRLRARLGAGDPAVRPRSKLRRASPYFSPPRLSED